jgi:uncharacterized damage-inducible protein DinB
MQTLITSQQLLEHWQGHRRLTRKVIVAFPENKIFSFTLGGMRPFSEMLVEFSKMTEPIVHGAATGEWIEKKFDPPKTKADLLALWDADDAAIARIWPTIPLKRFEEEDNYFGQYKSTGLKMILYAIDNETHHRAQAYVYLRALGITPPQFYDHA